MDEELPVLRIVEPIRPESKAQDIVAGLRAIADDLEKGDYDLVTTCVVVFGHTEERPDGDEYTVQRETYQVFGLGPRHDGFTVRGLLLTAATDLTGRE